MEIIIWSNLNKCQPEEFVLVGSRESLNVFKLEYVMMNLSFLNNYLALADRIYWNERGLT